MKLFSVLISNLDFDPMIVTSSKIAVEYMQIKPCPEKLLNKAITRQVHVPYRCDGSMIACQMLS